MRVARRLLSWLGLSCCCVLAAHGADADRVSVIRHLMADAGIPGLQTVVVKDGKIVWAKNFGDAVLAQPGPVTAMREDSLLWTASVGKLLTSIAILQQVDQGHLSLDDDINRYLPFSVRNPQWPDVPITWRMLLSHTSSLNEEDDQRLNATLAYGEDPKLTLDDVVKSDFEPGGSRRWAQQFTAHKPGTERTYSNDAFSLAAFALQSIVKEPFDRYVEHAILKPLHMSNTTYWLAGVRNERFGVGYASIRTAGGGFDYVPQRTYWAHGAAGSRALDQQMTCPDYPSGCVHSTARDFANLLMMFMNGGTFEGKRILSASTVDLMATPIGLRNHDGWTQGIGLFGPLDLRGAQLWGHDGVDRGAATAFFFNRKTGVGAIAFANANNPDFTLSYAVVDIDLHLLSWFE